MKDRTAAIIPVCQIALLAITLMIVGGASAIGQTETMLYTFRGQAGNDGYFPEINSLAG